MDLARSPVRSIEKLDRVRGLPRPVEQAHGAEILAATATGLAMDASHLPVLREADPSPQQRFRADSLYAAFLCLCAGRSIDPNLIASRQEVGEFFRSILAGESVEAHSLMTSWRRHAAGQAIIDLIGGKLTVNLGWKQMLWANVLTRME
jgi:ribonuclease D